MTPATTPPPYDRRRLLRHALALPALALAGCAAGPWPAMPAGPGSSSARGRLQECAAAQGLDAWRALHDVNVGYAGEWQGLVTRLQPVLVDAGFRGSSQERLLPGAGLVAQDHRGPAGHKQVLRRQVPGTLGEVQVWRNGSLSADRDGRDAAALVADGYRLFLFGTLALADFAGAVNWGPPEDVDGRRCDQLMLELAPGLGFAPRDRLSLFVDREAGWLRRLRFSLDGLQSTVGAVADVDLFDHVRVQGVVWPRRFFERLQAPIPGLPVHDWRLTGLDLDRGYDAAAISGPAFSAAAAAPARPLA